MKDHNNLLNNFNELKKKISGLDENNGNNENNENDEKNKKIMEMNLLLSKTYAVFMDLKKSIDANFLT